MVAAIAGVATVAGAAISADSAGDAASGQQAASQQANALQYQMFQENKALQAPAIQAGNAARDRLQYRLGLSPTGSSGASGGAPRLTYDQLRGQMVGQFTGRRLSDNAGNAARNDPRYQRMIRAGMAEPDALASIRQAQSTAAERDGAGATYDEGYIDEIDQAGLDAAVKARLAEYDTADQATRDAAAKDPRYGDLARDYVAERYTPETFKFGREDFQADPGFQFRLKLGQKALDRKAAAGGRFFSGSALTGASNFAGAMASDEYGNAFTRAINTFGTNEGNRRGAFALNEGNRFGAFQSNFNNAVNPLLSLAGAATLGSQNLGAAGANVANAVGTNLTNNANAQGAAGIAGANAISGGLTGAANSFQQNQLMQQFMNRPAATPWASVNNNPYPAGANYDADSASYSG